MPDSSTHRDPIEQMADSFLARYRAGERPSIEEYAAKYPELADEIRELLPALVKLEQNFIPEDAQRGASEAQPSHPPARQLGDYLLLREIGRGGMGVVYEAVQQSLGRHVALKVLAGGELRSPSQAERFRREARSAAQLHHTNIVPVFEVGKDGEVGYYAMQFIQGQGLDQVIDELRRLKERAHRTGPAREPERPDLPIPSGPTAAAPSRTRPVSRMAESLLTGRFV